ncbi:IS110 family transposase [uncultured Christiangramia sp.]|uniref:IS110 family transposase n=1 Tax=uncultured Christiangramia sp. TaxID=503836 RepID=UPI00260A85A0|nr:IS110 family transposase [uncultured Christiangramia sp.]
MDKIKHFYGVDISRSFFDVVSQDGKHDQFAIDIKGFKGLLKFIKKDSLVVMEATGYYHYRLAQYLYEKGITVSVVNPLSVKRFIQLKLSKIKTDKNEAKAICEYAKANDVPLYTASDKSQAEALQLIRLIDIYTNQSTALKNKLHGEKVLGKPSKVVYHSLNRSLKVVQNEIKTLEARLTEIVKDEQQKQLTLLKSIPGMGKKTAMLLIVLTYGFTSFENARQLCCFTGLTPTIRQSGTSVRGRSRISKVGNRKVRNLLFMCSFPACKTNRACREIYERIVEKGKSKKLALIAVCNKLLKQAFPIAKSGSFYQENYMSKLA